MTVTLHPFRYRDPLTGRWITARYKATREDIAAGHSDWEIIGPAEIRSPIDGAFHPYRGAPHEEVKRSQEPAPQINPHLERPPAVDTGERVLLRLFLRRYVTYCARRCRFAQMQGAARLYAEVTATMNALG